MHTLTYPVTIVLNHQPQHVIFNKTKFTSFSVLKSSQSYIGMFVCGDMAVVFFPDPNFPNIWKKTLPHTKWGKRKNIFQIYYKGMFIVLLDTSVISVRLVQIWSYLPGGLV